MTPKKTEQTETTEEILQIARKRFQLAVEANAANREEELDDLEFRVGDQWPEEIRAERERERRPVITVNKMPQYIRQVTNDQRQNRPSIKVNPVDDRADVDTAKIYQGLIRHIENNSNADVAYDTAFEGAATKGSGYFRIVTDYSDPNSFDQEIFIRRIRNSFSVYLDPHAQEADASDANWGFVFEDMSHDDYKAQYPQSKMASMTDWKSLGDEVGSWASEDTVRVAEYFYKTFQRVTIVQLSDGTVRELASLPKTLPSGITIKQKRESIKPAIRWLKINAAEILESTDWPGQWIPIIPVVGDEVDVNGRVIREGVIRHAKDPQRMQNFFVSAEAEQIALAPKTPFIAAEGQLKGYEKQWKTANTVNHSVLQYVPRALNGQPLPPPQRQNFEPAVQAITNARLQSNEDMKATTGIYDASLGARSNEKSGIAIQRRNSQAQTSNFHFIDNLSRALRHGGRILVDLIPHIYDTERVIRTLGEDDTVEMVKINGIFEHNGQKKNYRFGHGKYDVTVSSGPSFQTKRQEAVDSMMAMTQAYPKVAEVAGDLLVRNMDWPGASEIADRLKKTLPPGLVEENDKEKAAIPQEARNQMEQMSQMIEQLTQQLNKVTEENKSKILELESKERIENAKLQTQIEIELARLGSKEAIELLSHEIAEIQQRLTLLNNDKPIESESTGPAPLGSEPPFEEPTGGYSPGLPPVEG